MTVYWDTMRFIHLGGDTSLKGRYILSDELSQIYKSHFTMHACAPCSELPYHISTMVCVDKTHFSHPMRYIGVNILLPLAKGRILWK